MTAIIHATTLELTRRRLGRRRADVLLHDAATGRRPCAAWLARRMGVEGGVTDSATLGNHVWLRIPAGPGCWQGDVLTVPGNLPETITSALTGKPLGDLVAGADLDALAIREIRNAGTDLKIWVQADRIAPEDLPLSPTARLLGPLRRFRTAYLETWCAEYLDKPRGGSPTMTRIAVNLFYAAWVAAFSDYTTVTMISRHGAPDAALWERIATVVLGPPVLFQCVAGDIGFLAAAAVLIGRRLKRSPIRKDA